MVVTPAMRDVDTMLQVVKTISIATVALASTLVGATSHAQRFTIQCKEVSSHDHTIESLFNKPNVTKEQLINAFLDAGLLILIIPRPTFWTIDEQNKTVSTENTANFHITSITKDQIEAKFGSPDSSLTTYFSLSRISGKLSMHTVLTESRATEWNIKNNGILPTYWMWTMECTRAKAKF